MIVIIEKSDFGSDGLLKSEARAAIQAAEITLFGNERIEFRFQGYTFDLGQLGDNLRKLGDRVGLARGKST